MADAPNAGDAERTGGRVTRRRVLRTACVGLATLPIAQALASCSSPLEPVSDGGGSSADAGPELDATVTPTDATVVADGSTTVDAAVSSAWATGGTAAMTDRDSYPNPFEGSAGSACAITCGATLGPCHTTSPERADVSDGWDGLPVRLALRLVDESCAPVEDAIVEIWHTNHRGVYSGMLASVCNSAKDDRAAGYFRGYLRTDADGRVDFDTVFPGWYAGRAIHIHFRVLIGAYDAADGAAAAVISQLFFADALVESIFAAEPVYRDFGAADTLLGTDGVISGETDPSPYVCDVARLPDGAMHASKTIVLRTTGLSCAVAGAVG